MDLQSLSFWHLYLSYLWSRLVLALGLVQWFGRWRRIEECQKFFLISFLLFFLLQSNFIRSWYLYRLLSPLSFGKTHLTLTALSKSKWIKLRQRLEELRSHLLTDNAPLPIAKPPKMPSNSTELAQEELLTAMEVASEVKLVLINMANRTIKMLEVEITFLVEQMSKIGDSLKSRTDSEHQPTARSVVAATSLTWVAETDL